MNGELRVRLEVAENLAALREKESQAQRQGLAADKEHVQASQKAKLPFQRTSMPSVPVARAAVGQWVSYREREMPHSDDTAGPAMSREPES